MPDSAERFESLARLGQAVSASLDLSVLDSVAHAAIALLPDACARIWIADGERLVLSAEVGARRPRGDEKTVLGFGEGLGGRVAAACEALIVDDVRSHPLVLDRQWFLDEGFVSYVGVPLMVRDRLVGVLSLHARHSHEFTLHEVEVLGAFGAQAAVAIEHARLNAKLEARVRRFNTLTRLNQLISSSLDPKRVLREVAEAAATLMQAPLVAIWIADEATRTLHRGAMSDEALAANHPMASQRFGEGAAGWVAAHRQTLTAPDVSTDARVVAKQWFQSQGFTSYYGVPIVFEGALVGVMSLLGRAPFHFDEDQQDLLDSFVAQAAVAVRNARMFAQSERRRRAAEALEQVGRGLARSLDPEDVGRHIVDSVHSLIGGTAFILYRFDPGSGDLIPFAAAGAIKLARVQPRGTAAVGLAVRLREPVMTPNILQDSRIALTSDSRQLIEQSTYRAVLAIPLLVKDRVIGALGIADRAGRVFTDEEIRLVQAFADQAALALENARLLHESKTRQARLEGLLDVTRQVSGIQPLESLLGSIAQACGRLLDSDSVGFRLLEGDELVVTATWGDAAEIMRKRRLKIGESASGRVAATGRPLIVANIADDLNVIPEHRQEIQRLGYRSWLGVPVKAGDRLAGVLSVRTRREGGFSEADVAIATAFASQAAVALENARLYAESERRRRSAEALLDVASALGSTFELREILGVVAQLAAQAVGADRCVITLKRGSRLIPVAGEFADGHADAAAWGRLKQMEPLTIDDLPLHAEAIRTRQPLSVPDVAANPERVSFMTEFGARSVLVVPLMHQDIVVGALTIDRMAGPYTWPQEQIDLAVTIANQTALAMETARLFTAQREEAEVSGALLRLARAVEGIQDLDATLQTVARVTPQLLGLSRCGIFLYEPSDATLVPAAAEGFSEKHAPAFFGLRGAATIPAVVEALRSHEPVIVEDATEDTWIPTAVATALDIRSMLILPLVSGGRLMGALSVDTPGRPTTFADTLITLARGIAAQAAGAVDRAQLFRETERRRREAELFAELARTINASLDLDTVLRNVGECAREVCQSDRATIALRNPETDRMAVRYWFGYDSDAALQIEPGQGIGGLVLEAGRPARTSTDAGTELAVPIHIGDLVEGLLYVHNRSARSFSERDEAALVRLAEHAAIAIHNSQLFAREQSARSQAEASGQALRQSETRYRLVARATNDAIWDWDLITDRVEWNEGLQILFGYTKAAVGADARWWVDSIHPDDRERVLAGVQAAIRDRSQTWADEYRFRRSDGSYAFVADRGYVVHQGGRPVRMLGALADITKRKRAEEALYTRVRQQEVVASLGQRALADTSPARLIEEATRLVAETLNIEFCRVLVLAPNGDHFVPTSGVGWKSGETTRVGMDSQAGYTFRTGAPVIAEDIHAETRFTAGPALRENGVVSSMTALIHGHERPYGVLAVHSTRRRAFSPEDVHFLQSVAHVLATAVEQRRAQDTLQRNEEQVRQMQKMEAVGRLAGGVAHDFNNLLTVITGRSQLLLRRVGESDALRRDIALIQKTAERATVLTRQLLAFSRKQVLQRKVVEVDAVVRSLAPMLQRLLGEDIELSIAPPAGVVRVKVDPGQLEQVIVNLAVNARDAMPRGGRLRMEAASTDLDVAAVQQYNGAQPGPHVMLAVSDSGLGMDADTQSRIFEPFFTTKGPGQGTGLGLATVYGIVQQHQGCIAVESEVGKGTTFKIFLPATTDGPEPAAAERLGGLPAGGETVLLVEDEDEVRALARDILQQIGYTVLEAANVSDAVEICRRHPREIDLLLSDVIMPHMSGRELAERLGGVRPTMKVLYMSGYTADALGPRALLDADGTILQKPFTPDVLARKVREVLDEAK